MLFNLSDDLKQVDPVPFLDIADLAGEEKDLENLLADNLLHRLSGEERLLPVHQEKRRQAVADIYALDQRGDLHIFELKRSGADTYAISQVLRYAEDSSAWDYDKLNRLYAEYEVGKGRDRPACLQEAHKDAFALDVALSEPEFNRNQHLIVVASSSDGDVRRSVSYWQKKGVSIDFLPYRLYRFNKTLYLEFFAKPFDDHVNPGKVKGVIFDTNRTYNESALADMIENERVAAYGDRKDAVHSLSKGDFVFFYHKGYGVVAGAEVVGGSVRADGEDQLYYDVRFLTGVPKDCSNPDAISAGAVVKIMKKPFFWARIEKYPYLTREESLLLLEELKKLKRVVGNP